MKTELENFVEGLKLLIEMRIKKLRVVAKEKPDIRELIEATSVTELKSVLKLLNVWSQEHRKVKK